MLKAQIDRKPNITLVADNNPVQERRLSETLRRRGSRGAPEKLPEKEVRVSLIPMC